MKDVPTLVEQIISEESEIKKFICPCLTYHEPDIQSYTGRIQGIARGLRNAQYLYNMRKVVDQICDLCKKETLCRLWRDWPILEKDGRDAQTYTAPLKKVCKECKPNLWKD